jgi:hypothetical protein
MYMNGDEQLAQFFLYGCQNKKPEETRELTWKEEALGARLPQKRGGDFGKVLGENSTLNMDSVTPRKKGGY